MDKTERAFFHNGAMGDIIYSLPFIISLGGGTLYLCKRKEYDFLHALLATQDYLADVIAGRCPTNDYVNLGLYRHLETHFGMWKHVKHLADIYYDILDKGELKEFDLHQPWITGIEPKKVNKIVIQRNLKYRNKDSYQRKFLWGLLKLYEKDCLFVGLKDEHEQFKLETGLEVDFLTCQDALEMAQVIMGASLYIGNQSFGFALAEAMKQNRVLEVCWRHPNCIPATTNSFIELTSALLEEYVK